MRVNPCVNFGTLFNSILLTQCICGRNKCMNIIKYIDKMIREYQLILKYIYIFIEMNFYLVNFNLKEKYQICRLVDENYIA